MLVNAEPAPPRKGQNTWTLRLLDGSGEPVTGAELEATPFMPDHGHGAPLKPAVTEQADGTYRIERMIFQMPGIWETTITTTRGELTDEAVFTFCIGE